MFLPAKPLPRNGAGRRELMGAGTTADKPGMGKTVISMGVLVGSIIGGYAPVVLFHVSALSLLSIVAGIVGAFVGLYMAYKLVQWIEE